MSYLPRPWKEVLGKSIRARVFLIGALSPSARGMLINSVRDDFHAGFLIIILKDEQWRDGLDPPAPPGTKTFNYVQQTVFGRTWERWEHVVWLPGADGCRDAKKKKPKNLLVKELRKARGAMESGKYRWWREDDPDQSERSKTDRKQRRS